MNDVDRLIRSHTSPTGRSVPEMTSHLSQRVGHPTVRARFGARSHRGETLVELLVTISIVSIGVVAIVTAIGSTFNWASSRRAASHSDQLLVRYAEALTAVPYEPCTAGSAPYAGAAVAAIPSTDLPDGVIVGAPGSVPATPEAFELSVQSVTYWNGDIAPATFASACPSPDSGSQSLTVRVRAGDGSFDRTTTIVKRLG